MNLLGTSSILLAGRVSTRILLVTGLVACGGGGEVTGLDQDEWTLIWSDEFDGEAMESPDPTKWTFDIGTDWGNRQLEWTTSRPENVSMDGEGHLAITVREESFQGQPYTSGRIKTQGLFEQRFGRFVARIKVPSGAGIWPAFWMLGNDIDDVGWPQSGEIDVMEFRGQEVNVLFGALHGPGHAGADAYSRRYVLPEGRLDTDFHEYAIEWGPDRIAWFLDGELFHEARRGEVPGEWVYDHPFFLLLNVAVGGNFVGPVGEDVTFPRTMLVDWVRVYERAP